MVTLTPVEGDPFAPSAQQAKLTPVDFDPFAKPSAAKGAAGAAMDESGERQTKKPETWLEYADGIARAAAQGVTFGYADELAAALGSLTGNRKYSELRDQVRKDIDEFRAQHPVEGYGAEIGGAVAVPGFGLGKIAQPVINAGERVLGRVGAGLASGASVGAAGGALSGAGNSTEETISGRLMDAARSAGYGAAGGAAIGGVAVPAIELAGKGIRMAAEPFIGTVRGLRNPEQEAANRLAQAIASDTNRGLNPADYQAALDRGQPVLPIEQGGANTRAFARSAANTSPEAREILEGAVNPRFASQSERTADALRDMGRGNSSAYMTREQLQAEARAIRTPLYEQAYQAGSGGIDDAALIRLEAAPAMQRALKEARDRVANRHAVEGTEGDVEARIVGQNGYSLEYYDAAKQSLDDRIQAALNKGQNGEAREIIGVRDRLLQILDSHVPEYANARGTASTFFNASNALEAGENFATKAAKGGNEAARDALRQMSAREQELFREGFISRMVRDAEENPQNRNIVNMIANSPAAKQRVEMVLGPDGAQRLQEYMRVEDLMQKSNQALSGNSTTARQLVELGLIGGGTTYGAYSRDPYVLAATAILGGRKIAANEANKRVALAVAKLLTSGDPAKVQQAVTRIDSNQGLKTLFERLGRTGASAASRIPPASEDKQRNALINSMMP